MKSMRRFVLGGLLIFAACGERNIDWDKRKSNDEHSASGNLEKPIAFEVFDLKYLNLTFLPDNRVELKGSIELRQHFSSDTSDYFKKKSFSVDHEVSSLLSNTVEWECLQMEKVAPLGCKKIVIDMKVHGYDFSQNKDVEQVLRLEYSYSRKVEGEVYLKSTGKEKYSLEGHDYRLSIKNTQHRVLYIAPNNYVYGLPLSYLEWESNSSTKEKSISVRTALYLPRVFSGRTYKFNEGIIRVSFDEKKYLGEYEFQVENALKEKDVVVMSLW